MKSFERPNGLDTVLLNDNFFLKSIHLYVHKRGILSDASIVNIDTVKLQMPFFDS